MFFIETLFVVFYTSILTTISSCTNEIIENVVYLYISLLLQTLYRISSLQVYFIRQGCTKASFAAFQVN
jgi:hypothetical protein